MTAPRFLPLVLLACALGASVTACGSSSSSSQKASSTPATTTPAAASPSSSASSSGSSAAAALIAADWTAFFSAKTPEAKRVTLLQDGSQFASIIKSQAGTGLAAEATAKVTKVSVVSSTQAKVTYSILVSGQTMLTNQTGTAVYQDGTWKVGVASFCGLLSLENGGSTGSLPAACKATS
jgi:purine-cytosine permease-like protein